MRETYVARHAARDQARQIEESAADRIGNLRLGLAVVALVLVVLPLFTRDGTPWWMLIGVFAGFVALGVWHDKVSRRLRRARAAAHYFASELARLDEKWRSLPDTGHELTEDVDEERALLANDLDLFGPASLFQLTNRAITYYGRRTLARWLTEPASADVVRARQGAVKELADKLDAREAFAVAAAGDGETPLNDARLLDWAENLEPMPAGGLLRVLGIAQPILLFGTTVAFLVFSEPLPMVGAILAHIATILATRRAVGERAARLSTPDRALSRYAELIGAIESAGLTAPESVAIVERLATEQQPASERIRQLNLLVERLDARHNVFFSLTFGPILLWELNLVLRAERWQKSVGSSLRGWFVAIGELEALASLGAFSAARPDYAMPDLVDDEGVFTATKLAHPLIDRTHVVANDIELGGRGSVLLLSGSNMSGKSTFLRSIGINWVLARAGAPVAAESLSLSESALVTSIRVTDSLARGTSHFYAELERIKYALDAANRHGGRLLYLLDEMLHGTNSKERYIGAAGVIRWLSEQNAMGVVTTHDLALADVKNELPEGALSNKHFGDDVEDAKIAFDYTLKDGPVKSTNAIRLMRAIGIDIRLDTDASSAPASESQAMK